MITTIVLVILGVALIMVLKAMFRSGRPAIPAASPAAALPEKTIDADAWDAKRGDVISIKGAAADYSDVDFPVDRRSAYESSNRRWVDLSGLFRGNRVYLEVYRHPQPDYIGILDPRVLGIADLGASEAQLADLDSRQDSSASVTFEGKAWNWESSREIGYFENETGQGEGLYRWVFREPGGSRLLFVEKWEGQPFEVRLAVRLSKADISVYPAA